MSSRRAIIRSRALALLTLIAIACASGLNLAQQQTNSGSSPAKVIMEQTEAQDATFRGRGGDESSEPANMRANRYKAMNAMRQKALVEDTNRLLQLTTQLNAEIAGNPTHALNADQLRQVAEIEKLAKNVREKMTDAIGPTPPMMRPPTLGPSLQFSY